MNSMYRLARILRGARSLTWVTCLSILLILLSACSPAQAPAAPVEMIDVPTEIVILSPTIEPTQTAEPTAEPEVIYPSYLPLAIKPDVAAQTIDGVTTEIDWVYVDESRVALHYTISGLNWPKGSMLDGMQQVQISTPVLANAKSGGFSGAGGSSTNPADQGVITAETDQLLLADALDAQKHPNIDLKVDIPVEGPTKVGSFHFEFSVPVHDGFMMENIDQTVVANNVALTLKSLKLTPSYAEALICFQMPSAVDWGLTASKITVAGREYPFAGGGLVTGKNDPNSALTTPERCNDVGFNIAYDDQSDTSVILTVPKLMASVNEVVTKETVAMANQRLAESGIEFDYVSVDHGGNIVILKRPEGMPDEKIYPMIWDALAEQYEGPWIFTIPVER